MSERIRFVERTVLDTYHRSQPIFRRPAFQAIGHLLKYYGGIHREIGSSAFEKYSDQTLRQQFIVYSQALEWCSRWIVNECPNSTTPSTDDWQTIDQEVMSLFEWGVKYARLAVAHTAWSRGELLADADKDSSMITFSIKTKDPKVLIGQSSFSSLPGDRFFDAMPYPELRRAFRRWKRGFVHSCPPKVPDIDFGPDHPLCQMVCGTAKKMILPELGDSELLGEFLLGEYRLLYSVLFVHCHLLSQLEDYCDGAYGDENFLGSSVIQLPEAEMIDYLASLSGIGKDKVAAILDLLTFDTSYAGSIASQPFVKTGCGTISLLARLFCHVEPSDGLPRALLRKSKQVYDAIINRIEVKNVTSISESLELHALEVRMHQRLVEGDKYITPDLLVFDRQTCDLLVIDYKHSLTPIGPAEVVNRVRDHRKNIDQVKGYVEFLQSNLLELNRVFGFDVSPKKISAMVLYKSSMPLLVESQKDVVVADWMSLRKLIISEPITDLGQTIGRYQALSNTSISQIPWKIHSMETVVGDWTYRHEYFAAD